MTVLLKSSLLRIFRLLRKTFSSGELNYTPKSAPVLAVKIWEEYRNLNINRVAEWFASRLGRFNPLALKSGEKKTPVLTEKGSISGLYTSETV
jgi:hypothetical protein